MLAWFCVDAGEYACLECLAASCPVQLNAAYHLNAEGISHRGVSAQQLRDFADHLEAHHGD